ncbi:TM1266 family iron-only hydrogenase system putative regulator [Megasphaera stantonii]|uniref:TM1266 family iron-only hydrogenase system putative regulator n=1 Tax=Megasphaera stantonii TaxID=2144175 RepID=UPI00320B5DBB
METRLALIGIIVGKRDETTKLNELLHEYGEYIVGRMGVPYKDKDINVISIIIDAPQDTISALSGKLGMLPDVSTKTIYPPLPQ